MNVSISQTQKTSQQNNICFYYRTEERKKSNPTEEKAEIDNFKGRSEQYKNLQDRYTVYSLFITTRFDILPNYCSSHMALSLRRVLRALRQCRQLTSDSIPTLVGPRTLHTMSPQAESI